MPSAMHLHTLYHRQKVLKDIPARVELFVWTKQKHDDIYEELLASRAEGTDLGLPFNLSVGLSCLHGFGLWLNQYIMSIYPKGSSGA